MTVEAAMIWNDRLSGGEIGRPAVGRSRVAGNGMHAAGNACAYQFLPDTRS